MAAVNFNKLQQQAFFGNYTSQPALNGTSCEELEDFVE